MLVKTTALEKLSEEKNSEISEKEQQNVLVNNGSEVIINASAPQ